MIPLYMRNLITKCTCCPRFCSCNGRLWKSTRSFHLKNSSDENRRQSGPVEPSRVISTDRTARSASLMSFVFVFVVRLKKLTLHNVSNTFWGTCDRDKYTPRTTGTGTYRLGSAFNRTTPLEHWFDRAHSGIVSREQVPRASDFLLIAR